jgi:hypothetical protein
VASKTDRAAIIAWCRLPQRGMIGNEQRPNGCNCNCEDSN